MSKLKVEYRNIGDLIPYVNNSRTHSDEQVSQVAASIKEFGFTNPVLIDGDGGIIAGHGRVLAAKKLKLTEVPTITLTGLSEAQKKAYIIADNKLALNAGWDDELLAIEIEGLKRLDYDVELLGFDDDELSDLLPDMFEGDSGNRDGYEDGHEGEYEDGDDSPYSKKVAAPTYAPSDNIPEIEEMFDSRKTREMIKDIEKSSVDEDLKEFLKFAAYRHTVFDYAKIADFYSGSDKEVQELMEKSALVIIDINDAIKNGFVNLTDELRGMLNDIYEE